MMNSKIFILLLCISLTGVFTGCGKKEYYINDRYDTANLISVTGKKIDTTSDSFVGYYTDRGFTFTFPDSLWAMAETGNYTENGDWDTYKVFYYETENEEDRIPIFAFGYADSKDPSELARREDLEKELSLTEITTMGDNLYFFACLGTVPGNAGFTSTDKEKLQAVINDKQKILDGYAIFPPVKPEYDFSRFTAYDIDGNEVTEAVFADYDITMINIWTTWCGSCVREMPELEKLYRTLPDNVNMISICGDGYENPGEASAIIEETGISFPVIFSDGTLQEKYSGLIAYPTTIFVDRNGRMIGRQLTGVPQPENTAAEDEYRDRISKALKQVKENVPKENASAGEDKAGSDPLPSEFFAQQDLNLQCTDGRTIDQAFIKSHDLTIVNIWATFCGPCIEEMPVLEKISRENPDKIAVTGLLGDAYNDDGSIDDQQLTLGNYIIEKTGVTYPVLLADEKMQRLILGPVQAFPTTLFVDNTGRIIATKIGKMDEAGWRDAIDQCLKK